MPVAPHRGETLQVCSVSSHALPGNAFDSGMRRFESCRPSQPVGSPPVNARKPVKTARYRGISRIPLGLGVTNSATEAPFCPPVSGAPFWCLVFVGPSHLPISPSWWNCSKGTGSPSWRSPCRSPFNWRMPAGRSNGHESASAGSATRNLQILFWESSLGCRPLSPATQSSHPTICDSFSVLRLSDL